MGKPIISFKIVLCDVIRSLTRSRSVFHVTIDNMVQAATSNGECSVTSITGIGDRRVCALYGDGYEPAWIPRKSLCPHLYGPGTHKHGQAGRRGTVIFAVELFSQAGQNPVCQIARIADNAGVKAKRHNEISGELRRVANSTIVLPD